ncbi:hypothetical protein [Winogradskyella thalassocola]|uniref:Lipocalin-like domain-containing protein n=1 Tax=Winogradskyella thalassocola TaxID=262004 RepID=A0A1G8I8N6_9FLAO|nr:hypothetical protein [Winogradskyella thalassocola]SDI15349.1 hypothetical protein SAMN04489796_107173 [Winogradskyella thalassocola]
MKIKSKYLFINFLFVLFCFTSCQDEITQIENPNDQETIVSNSTLANLMSRTTANFGAADDILDSASCFSVELPVTIVISDITIVIETQSDLQQLESLYNESSINDDFLDFVFPISIIFNDYSQIVIENEDELQGFVSECGSEENDAIECVDFVYPISFSVFNAGFNLIDTVIIESDEALYGFLNGLEEDENAVVVSLNFPVTLEYANGDTVEVNTNQDLAEAIELASDDCDEDDCTAESVKLNLKECQWKIMTYSSFPEFVGIDLVFYSNDTFAIFQDGSSFNVVSNWSVISTDGETYLYLETEFEDLGGDWKIVECDDNTIQFTKGEQTMVINQVCEDDLNCSLTDISSILQQCPWDFSDGTGNFENDKMIFNANGDVQISEGMATSAIGGGWNLSVSDEGILLTFSDLTAFQESLEGDWLIVECDTDRIVLHKGDQTLVLEQNCNGDLFSCFGDFEIVECTQTNNVPVFNLSANTIGLVICTESFVPSFHETLNDAENNTNPIEITETYGSLVAQVYLRIEASNGDYEVFNVYLNSESCANFDCFINTQITACGIDGFATFNLTEANQECGPDLAIYGIYYYGSESDLQNNVNPINPPESYTNLYNPTVIYAAVLNVYSNIIEHIFTIDLIVEDCNYFECFESFDAVIEVCDDGSDGPYEFNLPIAFANCTPSADDITYYETLADANSDQNLIANPSAYSASDVSSIVYVRVEIQNQFEIFPIQLTVVTCNVGNCTEGDINGILTECLWNVASYNGSDNLSNYNFHFEQNSGIVVIYTDTITIDATWSTSQASDGVVIDFSNVTGPNIQAINGSWLVVECTENQLVLHNVNDSSIEIVLDRTCE